MKIAAITITQNDDYKIDEWYEHYQGYKNDLYLHIIVDNNSKPAYLDKVKEYFADSIIIPRETNGGCTIAYNDGIRKALQNEDVDTILLIGNDCKLENGGLPKLYDFLLSEEDYGMVSPIMMQKDSDIIEDFGSDVSFALYMNPFMAGKSVSEVKANNRESKAVLGGLNLAKREYYESIGFQDENLFMYSDEIDNAFRSKVGGYKLGVTSEVRSWHQHINPPGKKERHPFSAYLIARNKIYLAYKHFGLLKALFIFLYNIIIILYYCPKILINKELRKSKIFFLYGSINGLLHNMKPNKYSSPID